jgi:hypothetical protein
MLPVYSVQTEEEAARLLALACPRNYQGQYVAPELAAEQTLERLLAFGERLDGLYRKLILPSGKKRRR